MATSPLIQPDIRNQYIARLLQQGTDTSPVGHPTQAFARMAQALMGGLEMREQDREGREAPAEILKLWQASQQQGQPAQHPLGTVTSGPRPMNAPPTRARETIGGLPIYSQGEVNPMDVAGAGHGNAIASIESGGRYNLQGPVTRSGDRAYGKYQVMGTNVPAFTREATGTAATPQQFLANPNLQENTFNAKFAEYINRFGSPEAAARAWFAGEGGMNDPNRRDQLGTTVANYGQRFAQAAGVPQAAPAAGAPVAMPQGGQPQAMPQQAQVPPIIQQAIRSDNPRVRAYGAQLLQAWQTQQMAPPKFHKLNDEMLFDERTGRTQTAGPGFRPLTDPAERARFGIPADDKRPYQVGPGNKLINPPAETRLTVDQRGESAFSTNAAKLNAERFNKLVEGGFEAQSMVADLGALRDIGSRITTGKTAQITQALGPYAEMVGVKIDGLDDMQAYQAIISRMAPRMRVAGSGATSDFEMRQFLSALPQLGTTPQGNEIITNTLQSLQEHRMAAADIASRALAGEITPRQAEQELRKLPNPLELWKKSRGNVPSANPSRASQGQTSSGVRWSTGE